MAQWILKCESYVLQPRHHGESLETSTWEPNDLIYICMDRTRMPGGLKECTAVSESGGMVYGESKEKENKINFK